MDSISLFVVLIDKIFRKGIEMKPKSKTKIPKTYWMPIDSKGNPDFLYLWGMPTIKLYLTKKDARILADHDTKIVKVKIVRVK